MLLTEQKIKEIGKLSYVDIPNLEDITEVRAWELFAKINFREKELSYAFYVWYTNQHNLELLEELYARHKKDCYITSLELVSNRWVYTVYTVFSSDRYNAERHQTPKTRVYNGPILIPEEVLSKKEVLFTGDNTTKAETINSKVVKDIEPTSLFFNPTAFVYDTVKKKVLLVVGGGAYDKHGNKVEVSVGKVVDVKESEKIVEVKIRQYGKFNMLRECVEEVIEETRTLLKVKLWGSDALVTIKLPEKPSKFSYITISSQMNGGALKAFIANNFPDSQPISKW